MIIAINYQQLFVVCVLLSMEYIFVLFTVIADLISGIRKAKQRGKLRSSYGFRRTVDKLARYYIPLFALTIVDTMQMIVVGFGYLNGYHGYSIPLLPILTLFGAIGIGIIEVKSILEKAEDKVKFERVGALAGNIIKNKDDAAAIIAELGKYFKEQDNENEITNKGISE